MNSEVEEPFQYGYFGGWEVIISSFELLMFAILAICIVIAPGFLPVNIRLAQMQSFCPASMERPS